MVFCSFEIIVQINFLFLQKQAIKTLLAFNRSIFLHRWCILSLAFLDLFSLILLPPSPLPFLYLDSCPLILLPPSPLPFLELLLAVKNPGTITTAPPTNETAILGVKFVTLLP